jgi:hypothetical protein
MRRILLAAAAGAAALLLLGALLQRARLRHECDRAAARNHALAADLARSIADDVDRAARDVRLLASLERESDIEAFAAARPDTFQVRLLDLDGRERLRFDRDGARVVRASVLQDKSDRYYVRDLLAPPPGGLYVSPLDWNIEFGRVEIPERPTLRIGTRRTDALVLINIDARTILRSLRETSAGFGGAIRLLDGDRLLIEASRGAWTFLPARPAAAADEIAGRAPALGWTLAVASPRADAAAQASAGVRDHLLLIALANQELLRTRAMLVERTRLATLGEMVPARGGRRHAGARAVAGRRRGRARLAAARPAAGGGGGPQP